MTRGTAPGEGFPTAEGARLPWSALPAAVLGAIEDGFGARVVDVANQPGGFSPGVAARVQLSDGRRASVKAISSSPNPRSPEFHRREAKIAAALPRDAPIARLMFVVDDGEWIALAFEDIDGAHPVLPWRGEELDRVLRAISDLTSSLTPSPIETARISEDPGETFQFVGWRELAENGDVDIDPWARTNIARLAELESGWSIAASGETLLHADLRADNILVTPSRVVFVDWPHACIGAAWVDLVFFLPASPCSGGPTPGRCSRATPWAKARPRKGSTPSSLPLPGSSCGAGRSQRHPVFPGCRRSRMPRVSRPWRGFVTGWERAESDGRPDPRMLAVVAAAVYCAPHDRGVLREEVTTVNGDLDA